MADCLPVGLATGPVRSRDRVASRQGCRRRHGWDASTTNITGNSRSVVPLLEKFSIRHN